MFNAPQRGNTMKLSTFTVVLEDQDGNSRSVRVLAYSAEHAMATAQWRYAGATPVDAYP